MRDFHINQVTVRPRLNLIEVAGRQERLPAKFVDVLTVLAEHPGKVIAKKDLLDRVWNDPLLGDEALSHAVWVLRKALGDDAKRPTFIETIPRRGYRLIAELTPIEPAEAAPMPPSANDDAPIEPVSSTLKDETAPPPETSLLDTGAPSSVPAVAPSLPPTVVVRRTRWLRVLAQGVVLFLSILLIAWVVHLTPGRSVGIRSPSVLAFRTGPEQTSLLVPWPGQAMFTSSTGVLFNVDTRVGRERWRFSTNSELNAAPLIADDHVYVGADDGFVYAAAMADGVERWRFQAEAAVHSIPAKLASNLAFGDVRGTIYALDAERGALRWRSPLTVRTLGPLLAQDGLFLCRLADATLVALDAESGNLRWQRQFEGPLSDLVALPDGAVFASDAGFVAALSMSDGGVRWQVALPAAESTPLVYQGMVYALGRYGDLLAVQAGDGRQRWQRRFDIADPSPPIAWAGRLVIALEGGRLGLVSMDDGHLQQQLAFPEAPRTWAADGDHLLVATLSGRVYRLAIGDLIREPGQQLSVTGDGALQTRREPLRERLLAEALSTNAALPTLLWRARVLGHVQDLGIDPDGSVYLSDERSALALNAQGMTHWQVPLSTSLGTGPAMSGQLILFGRRDHWLYALDRANGRESWRFRTMAPIIGPPAIFGQHIYVGSDDRRVYALDREGTQRWSFETRRPVRSTPIEVDGSVYVGSADRNLYALSAADGKLRWRFQAEDWLVAHPEVRAGRVFIGAGNGDFHALDANSGAELWRFHTGGKIWFRPALDADTVYFGSGDGHLYALDQRDGRERWRYRTGSGAEGSVVLAEGRLYAGSRDHHLYALEAQSGRPLWRLRTGGSVFNPSVRGSRLVVASADQHVYALQLPPAAAASDPP